MVVTLMYYRLSSQKARTFLLLIASCYFYMSFVPKYILILGGTIVIDYFAGLQIARNKGHLRKTWLIISLAANIGILAYFKYFNFILGNLEPFLQMVFPRKHVPIFDILLPIGLSFHTFQAMSYTIEVYRGKQAPERDFFTYALYVMFYPQLVAGPIERPQNMLPQLRTRQEYKWDNVKEGLTRMLWGLFKKVVIADRIAAVVDYSFDHINTQSSLHLLLGAALYSFQIYCDFSGYSDIGIGAAKVMGIGLMENFNEPYRAHTMPQFWSRWHISLSTWFRDYVYIPLGGNRLGNRRRKLNIMIVFLLSGLWHGANWTFVVWGGLHGILTAFSPGSRKSKDTALSAGKIAFISINFLLVTLLWIFFRAPNLHDALHYLYGIFSFRHGLSKTGVNNMELALSMILIGIMLVREYKYRGHYIKDNRLFACYTGVIVIACYFLGVFNENQFIYFQF
ncbi:MBOAT family O-acyltransferase [Mucilaginibacter sp. McL0603]|uniref:MBOAT family O-acyltransferase n=1 Tax=Mucilaginibacter sp. McL0603 TaxID=3415670 RepID=UPI003CF3C483